MEWQMSYYNEALQQEIMKFSVGFQARYIHLTQRMMIYGDIIGMPHFRARSDGLFDLHLKSEEGTQILYCTLVGNKIVILHTYVKKSKNPPLRELEVALRRMQEVKANDDA
ncbi:MAG TPA: type II toxin-antitoxin system RelE/ParE family toxin [Thioploca sp.]|nr:MAG: type II toxin-antitoxin system RelE/ParE family toxin [Gammaproteobacteria bacterium]HDN25952.1 type II toxin-antitoxin system RelE/ParE family toxin [Thioploca sp.]